MGSMVYSTGNACRENLADATIAAALGSMVHSTGNDAESECAFLQATSLTGYMLDYESLLAMWLIRM